MSGRLQKYAEATMLDLARVIDAAGGLYACVAKFPDDPDIWAEDLNALDLALEACPGTSAHYHKQQNAVTKCPPRYAPGYEHSPTAKPRRKK